MGVFAETLYLTGPSARGERVEERGGAFRPCPTVEGVSRRQSAVGRSALRLAPHLTSPLLSSYLISSRRVRGSHLRSLCVVPCRAPSVPSFPFSFSSRSRACLTAEHTRTNKQIAGITQALRTRSQGTERWSDRPSRAVARRSAACARATQVPAVLENIKQRSKNTKTTKNTGSSRRIPW